MKLVGLMLLAGLAAVPLWADSLTIALTPSTLSGLPGSEVIFSGTLTDTDTANTCDTSPFVDCLDLNNISLGLTFNPSQGNSIFTLDDGIFYGNVPGPLSDDSIPGFASYTGPIFGIEIAANAAAGLYTNSVIIYGAHDDQGDVSDQLASLGFTVQVLAPEPAPYSLMLLGIGAIVLARRRAIA